MGGCGRFQVLMVVIAFAGELVSPFSLMFMVFGNYNPGWTCLHNSTMISTVADNFTSINKGNPNDSLGLIYVKENCQDFDECQHVQFNPESSTIVSEWHLICGKSWITPFITSLQMVGVMIGAYLSGYLSDRFGRLITMRASMVINGLSNFAAAFSISWEMFLVLRFLIGLTYPMILGLPFVYSSEMSPIKWRSFLASFPAWNIGLSLFAVTALFTKNWKYIHFITAAITLGLFFPMLWIPESIRWLTVKGKVNKAVKVANKVSLINKVPCPDEESLVFIEAQNNASEGTEYKYSWKDLWHKSVRLHTLGFGFIWISLAVIYYTTSFGMKNLVGNFYINLILMFITELPSFILTTLASNIIGRKWTTFLCLMLSSIVSFVVVFLDRFGDDSYKGLAIFILILIAKFFLLSAWFVLYMLTAEMYPTVIRGTALGYGSCLSRIGAIIAPYLISNSSDSNFLSFLIMACLYTICALLLLIFPETKGRSLRETWSED